MKDYLLRAIDHLSLYGLIISGASLLAMMTVEFLNALGREFIMPLPCGLEMSESLMITAIFLAVPYVALEEGHTNVTILTRKFPARFQRGLDSFSHLFGVIIFSILAWGGWKLALISAAQLEIRIGVFRFPIWPFKICFAIGLTVLVFQSLSNTIRSLSEALDRKYKGE